MRSVGARHRFAGARRMSTAVWQSLRMRHDICSTLVAGALALGSLFAIAPTPVAADASAARCVVPRDLARLDLPLTRTARHLAAHRFVMIVALGSSSTAGAGASSAQATYPSRLMAELAGAVRNAVDHRPQPRHRRRTRHRHAGPPR